MIFVKPAVRKSLLAKMLGEILDTRVMVKQGMKGAKGNKVRCATCRYEPKQQLTEPDFTSAIECSTARSQIDGCELVDPALNFELID